MVDRPLQTWSTLLRRPAIKEESLWLALFAIAVIVALALGVNAVLAVAVGLSAYALWHLAQALRLMLFLLNARSLQSVRVWGVWRDVFDQVDRMKRRERKRKRRQQRFFSRFREVASVMPDAVIVLGSAGEVSWFNRQAETYFGLREGMAVGRRLVDLVDHPFLQNYLESGNFDRVLEMEAPGDPAVMLSISVNRFKRRGQRHLLVARDITRLYHLNRAQRDFTLNVSHELRTPLTVLYGYLEILFDAEQAQSPRWRPLQRMLQQTRRMQDVIQDLSMLSRLEDEPEKMRREPVAVFDLLEDIVAEGRELGHETEHVLELTGDSGLVLLGDESLLRSAFSNLVFNAIRHTPIRTKVSISWGVESEYALLQVRDNGAGIPTRHLPRLTERFYRVDAGRSRDAGGTGLGLAIVRQILDVHDAGLLISSEEGRGSNFTCRFSSERFTRTPEVSSVESGVEKSL